MEENKEYFGSLCDMSRGENCVEIHIGNGCLWFRAEPGENNQFELSVVLEEDSEIPGDGTTVFEHVIDLTKEEADAACESSMEDFLFHDNVDSLAAQKLAKSFFSFVDKKLGIPRQYGEDIFNFPDKEIDNIEKYVKDLIHKRMRGELISEYIPGYEPQKK